MKYKFLDKRVITQSTFAPSSGLLERIWYGVRIVWLEDMLENVDMFEKFSMQIYSPISRDEYKVVTSQTGKKLVDHLECLPSKYATDSALTS